MFQSFRPSSRKMRSSLDLLEERALLNAATPHRDRLSAAPTEVIAAKRTVVPIAPNLPSMPNSRITTIPASGDINP
jgi:hypothetical protein